MGIINYENNNNFSNLAIFWYHKNILSFLEKAVFAPDDVIFDLYCKLNPGYQIQLLDPHDLSTLVSLHKPKLENFWKFNVATRVMEIVQFYTDRLFMIPKKILGTPYVHFDTLKLKREMLIPQELLGKLERFLNAVNTGRDVIHEISGAQRGEAYHAECFDNLVKDMYSFVNMVSESNIASERSISFVPLPARHYLDIVQWLAQRVDNAISIYSRDTDLFYQMLRVFLFIHHMPIICGKPVKESIDFIDDFNWRTRYFKQSQDPTFFLRNPQPQTDSHATYKYLFQSDSDYKAIEEKMMYYGHLTIPQALCTRAGILPKPSNIRTPSMDIVRFLATQEFLYGNSNNYYEECAEVTA